MTSTYGRIYIYIFTILCSVNEKLQKMRKIIDNVFVFVK